MATVNGQPRKLLAQASRNGQFFVLDRTNGKALVSAEYVKTQLVARATTRTASRFRTRRSMPQLDGALVTPNQGGATNWHAAQLQPA